MTLIRRARPWDDRFTLWIPKAEEIMPKQIKISVATDAWPEPELVGIASRR